MNQKNYSVIESGVVIITVIAIGFVLSKAAQVAIPFMLAFLLSLLLSPVMKLGIKYKLPPAIMVLGVLIGFIAVCFPLGIFLNARLQGTMEILPEYYNRLLYIGQSILVKTNMPKDFLATFNWHNTVGRHVSGMTGFFLHWFGDLLMITVFLIFMLLEYPHIENRLNMAYRGGNASKIKEIGNKIVYQISRYLQTLAIISFVTGTCVWLALRFLNIDFALTWGVLAFFLNFIPTIGSILASIPPILIALVQFYPNWVPSVIILFSLLTIQFIIGNIITPKIMGDALDLNPIVILISLLFWGLIWGFSGALLAVPITVVIKIICENIPQLHFINVLIGSAKEKTREDNH